MNVRLALAGARADVSLDGTLDQAVVPAVLEAIDSARVVGCRTITVHLRATATADDDFDSALRSLRESTALYRAVVKIEIAGGALASSQVVTLHG